MVIVLTGPTAVGKTEISNFIAKEIGGEIINADSTQVYKGLNIATAKIKKEEMLVPHHLIDIKNIEEDYTVFHFQRDCRQKIEEIKSRNKIPIIVGGTGLYIKAALFDYRFEEEASTEEYEKYTNKELLNMLKEENEIHINNRKRLIRAVANQNKSTYKKGKENLLYDTIFIGLTMDREKLYSRINKRVDLMIEEGLEKEAKTLIGKQYKSVMTPIGYKEFFQYFDLKLSFDEVKELIKKRTRNYAKRQYTFFNNQFSLTWFDLEKVKKESILKYVKEQI